MQLTKQVNFWAMLVLISTAVFWLTDLDLQVASLFHTVQGNKQLWLLDHYPWWRYLFYDSVPYLAGLSIGGCIGVILFSTLNKRRYRWRLYASYILLVFLLGPGLLVNSVFKDHWGRPRPVQVQQLGGTEAYTPPLIYVPNGDGRSFPSGHSSVGFSFIAFWFLWRERHPLWAKAALIGSLSLGAAIGVTRMAAGGHFLSDVLWSLWMPLGVAWLLYYPVLHIPEREAKLRLEFSE